MQFNPYSAVQQLPQNQIASLLSGAGQSLDRTGQAGTRAIDALRSVGQAKENEMYNAKLNALQQSPEFLNANPIVKQQMINQASSGLELDTQNIRGQEQLFKQLGAEQANVYDVEKQKQAQINALENLGIEIGARQSEADTQRGFLGTESEKGRLFTSAESEKGRNFTSNESEKERGFKKEESFLDRLFRSKEFDKKIKADIEARDDQQNFERMLQGEKFDFEAGQNLKKLLAEAGKQKETSLSRKGVGLITGETIPKAVKDVQEYISDNEDYIFDRKLNKQSKILADQVITEFIGTPKGQEMIATGARPEEIWNELSKTFTTKDVFDITNILPFGQEMFEKKLIPK